MSLPWRRWTRRGRGGPACSLPVEGDRTCGRHAPSGMSLTRAALIGCALKSTFARKARREASLAPQALMRRAGGNVRPVFLGAQPMCFLRSGTVRNLVCRAIVKPQEAGYGDQE